MSDSKIDFYNIPIAEYLLMIGEPIIEIGGGYYQHKDHDSLKINSKRNYFVWNSRSSDKNAKGGVVQYLQIVRGYTLAETLASIENSLLGKDFKVFEPKKKEYPKYFNYRVKETPVPLEAQKYLVTKRKIPNRIIRHFFSLGLITQNEYEEIIFKWFKNEKVVGFTKQGTRKLTDEEKEKYHTKRDYFKYVAETTEEDTFWGFNYLVGVPKQLFFFESPIDLLSYYTLHEKELITKGDFWLISVDGTGSAQGKVISFLTFGLDKLNLKDELSSLSLCFDNDRAGDNSTAQIQEQTFNGIEFIDNRPKKHKDWNETLEKETKK
ncbi:toprim domain-containing protein [Enterococcus sp. AZ196]|uniref:toprim domain-containing protein n=1 Tax=Enterococcus sp. AZ196 TaxID=2774659 RepID=UPI003D2C99C3